MTTPSKPVSETLETNKLRCPKCGGETKQDSNSFQCSKCEQLWPLTDFWIKESVSWKDKQIPRIRPEGYANFWVPEYLYEELERERDALKSENAALQAKLEEWKDIATRYYTYTKDPDIDEAYEALAKEE